jgi:hypothetical protein
MEVAQAVEVISYRDEFYPAGFRKLLALMMISAVVAIPPLFAWQHEPVERPARSFPTGRYAPRGAFLPDREPAGQRIAGAVLSGFKHLTIAFVVTLGLALYYPRSGFKRYSLLCGPLIAWLAPLCVAAYLAGRTEVFRFEIVLATIASALPGAALYVWLTWRKAQRQGMVW